MLAYFIKKKKWILKSFICNQMEVATLIFFNSFFCCCFLAAGELGPSCSCGKKKRENERKEMVTKNREIRCSPAQGGLGLFLG